MNLFERIHRITFALVLGFSALLLPGSGGPVLAERPATSLRVLSVAPQSSTCIVLQPGPANGIDAYIKEDKPNENRGDDVELRVTSESGKLNRTLLQFDLSSLPGSATVVSATLSLWVTQVRDGNMTISAHQVITSWNEAKVTWNDRDKAASLAWTTPGGDYDSTALASVVFTQGVADYWASWDVTAAASAWLSNPADNHGLILESPATSPRSKVKFTSSDDGAAGQRPKLEVCYSLNVTVAPDNVLQGIPGQTKTYAHQVTVDATAEVVTLSATSSQGWTTRIYEDENGNGIKDPADDPITQTPLIGPNATYNFLVQVDIPPTAPLGMTDVTTVTGTGQTTGDSDSTTDRTTVAGLITLQPDHSLYAEAGTVLFYGHTITNNGASQDCVTVAAASSQGWTVLLWEDTNQNGVHETNNPNEPPLTNPVCVDAGATYYLVAEVQVPSNAAVGTVDQTVITATSGNDPGVSDTATDTTEVFINTPPVVDGKYDDIYQISPDAQEVCYTSGGVLFGKLATFYRATDNAVYVVLAIDKDFVDNTYGANQIGWPGNNHTFSKLVGSDRAQFWGYDSTNTKVLDFDIDYISADGSNTISGYSSLGLGGDGGMNTGNAAHILEWGTSLDYDLNSLSYCAGGDCSILGTDLLVDSPATDAFYTPNPTYPDWIFDVIYEVKIDAAAFGSNGFGHMEIPYIHASPSKTGTNTIYAQPGVCPGQIGDFVWHDLDGDGLQDGGEPGIDGVDLKLYQDDGDGIFDAGTDTLIGTRTTTAGGKYLFQDLAPGDYFVDVVDATVPAGLTITTFNDPTSLIQLDAGESYLQADFGYNQFVVQSSLGDFVWHDLNGNGLQDQGEPGLDGVLVELYTGTCPATGSPLASQTTAGGGAYLFAGLAAGDYCVKIADSNFAAGGPLDGYQPTQQDAGADDSLDSDGDLTTHEAGVTLGSGQDDLSIDFGFYLPVTVGDFTWIDTIDDGIFDPGSELPLNGVFISVTNSAGTTVALVQTGPGGSFGPGEYLVDGLAPGVYTATVVSWPTGFLPSGPTQLTSVFLNSGEQDLTLDFPFINTTGVDIVSLTALQRGQVIAVRWTTLREGDNQGFHIWRATAADGPYQRLTTAPIPSQAVAGGGASYQWLDATVRPGGHYWYRLETAPDGQIIGPVQATMGGQVFLPIIAR